MQNTTKPPNLTPVTTTQASPTSTDSIHWQHFKRFVKAFLYCLLHSAIIVGTGIAYAATLTTFLTFLIEDEDADGLFKYCFIPCVIIGLIGTIRDWARYSHYIYEMMNIPGETAFHAKLAKDYEALFSRLGTSNRATKATVAFASATLSIESLDWSNGWEMDSNWTRKAAVLGAAIPPFILGILGNWPVSDKSGFQHGKVFLASASLSLSSVLSYVCSVILALHKEKDHLGLQEKNLAYTGLGVLVCLIFYYYLRLDYDEAIIGHNKARATQVQSRFTTFADTVSRYLKSRCHPQIASLLEKLSNVASNIGNGAVSLALLYSLWHSWRSLAMRFGILNERDASLYPSTLSDVFMLIVLGIPNVLARFARFKVSQASPRTPEQRPLLPIVE